MNYLRPNIILIIPTVWSYRNFIINGITLKLSKKYNLYYAIPEVAKTSFLDLGIDDCRLIILKSTKCNVLQIYLFRILKKSFGKMHPVNTTAIFKKIIQIQQESLKDKFFFQIPSLLFSVKSLFNLLRHVETKLYFLNLKNTRLVLQNLKPHFILSTTNVIDTEWAIFRVAQEMKIQTFTHILSFDNLTSRGYLPIENFDIYFVWNQTMKNELIKYYNVDDSKIIISGTPQFDYHTDPEYKLTRSETLKKLGLLEENNYILYCANHHHISPNEPELLDYILNEFSGLMELSSYKIILRFHPMDNYERWNKVLKMHPSIFVSIPWEHKDENSTFWGNPTIADLILFSNTLRYSSVMLNIASTVSIDAGITDTPVVCLGFHPTIKTEGEFYNEVHFSEHYAPIMQTKATPLANSVEELIDLIIDQLQNPEKLKAQRLELKRRFLPKEIQSSASVLLNTLMNVGD